MSTHDESRDFAHQPPNRADLESFERAPLACRIARERMRDFADGDLGEADHRLVEHHAHECRGCALALARAEFESMRLRRAFADGWSPAAPRPGFAKRALARALALEPEAALQAESIRRINGAVAGHPSPDATPKHLVARVMAKTVAAQAASRTEPIAPAHRRTVARALSVVGLLLIVFMSPIWHSMTELTRSVRLAVVRAESASRLNAGNLSGLLPGDGLGEGDMLVLGEDGSIDAEFYDASVVGEQPAAQIRMSGDSDLLVGMQLQLDHGDLEILSHRPMGLLLGDGSTLELGSGLYRIHAEQEGADGHQLALRIEVERGDPARIAQASGATRLVSVGQAASYGRGAIGIAVENLAQLATAGAASGANTRQTVGSAEAPELVGRVTDAYGSPLAHASVRLAFPTSAGYVTRSFSTDHSGLYVLPQGSGILPGVAMLEVLPPAGRGDLEFSLLDAHHLEGEDGRLTLDPVVLGVGAQVRATIETGDGHARPYALALPVFYDEALGQVWPWSEGAVYADVDGRVNLRGLPSQLTAGRSVGVVVFHPDDETVFLPLSESRGGAALEVRLQTRSQTSIAVSGLPPSRVSSILEEVVGLPPGLAVRRHLVHADINGQIASMRCGRGRLWLEAGPASATLYPISRGAEVAEVGGEHVERRLVLQPMQQAPGVAGSGLEIAVQDRYRDAVVGLSGGEELFVQSPSGQLADRAQAFALRARVGGGFDARFLGLSHLGASLRVHLQPGESELLALGQDGSIVRQNVLALRGGSSHGWLSPLAMEYAGRAELATVLAPAAEVLSTTWSPLAVGAVGARPEIYRVLRREAGFAAESLPAGDYQVRDGQNRTFRVRILPGQTSIIR